MKNRPILDTLNFGGYQEFNKMLATVLSFAYPDKGRHNPLGVNFELKNGTLNIKATDGSILMQKEYPISPAFETNFTLEYDDIIELLKMWQDYYLENTLEQAIKVITASGKEVHSFREAGGFPLEASNKILHHLSHNKNFKSFKYCLADFDTDIRLKSAEDLIDETLKRNEIERLTNEAISLRYCFKCCLEDETDDDLDEIIEKLKKLGVSSKYSINVDVDLDFEEKSDKNPTEYLHITEMGFKITEEYDYYPEDVAVFNYNYFQLVLSAINEDEFTINICKNTNNAYIKSGNTSMVIMPISNNKNN